MTQIDSKVDSNGPSKPTDSTNRLFILAVAAVAVIGIGAIAILATSGGDSDSTATQETAGGSEDGNDGGTGPVSDGAQTGAVEVSGTTLSPMPEGVRIGTVDTDPEFGASAPSLVGTGFDGAEVRIEPDGQPKVIYFLAHWCPHCQEEVPVVQELIDSGVVPDGLEIYAVSTGVNEGAGNYPPSDWFVDEDFTPTVVRDDADSSAFRSLGGGGFPYAIYLDADHKVVARSSGNVDGATTTQLWELAAAGS